MEKDINLQPLKCPSCGASLLDYNVSSPQITCPYCHTQMNNLFFDKEKIILPEKIIPFTITRKEFIDKFKRFLIDKRYTPVDIPTGMQELEISQYYVPMFLFEGKYQATWTGTIVHTYVNGNNDFSQEANAANGTAVGNFAILSSAFEGSMPQILRDCTKILIHSPRLAKPFNIELLSHNDDNVTIFDANLDADSVWAQNGEDLITHIAQEQAKSQVNGRDCRDFQSYNSYDLKHNGKLVLASFYIATYKYKNDSYYFVLNGCGESVSEKTPTIEEEEKRIIKELKKKAWWRVVILLILFYISILITVCMTAAASPLVWFLGIFEFIIFGIDFFRVDKTNGKLDVIRSQKQKNEREDAFEKVTIFN